MKCQLTDNQRQQREFKVINTRPKAQADNLNKQIEKRAGALSIKVIDFPLIEINTLTDILENKPNNKAPSEQLAATQLIIFISANAVVHLLKLAQKGNFTQQLLYQLKQSISACVGRSTANILAQQSEQILGQKIIADVVPDKGSDSEALIASLLESDKWQQVQATGQEIKALIVRGQGGREFLAQQLRQLKVAVSYWEVYQRVCPEAKSSAEQGKIAALWFKSAIDCMLVTSSESLANLLKLLGSILESQSLLGGVSRAEQEKQIFQMLKPVRLLVVHEKIKSKARQMGFENPIIVADAASDQALSEALIRQCQVLENR